MRIQSKFADEASKLKSARVGLIRHTFACTFNKSTVPWQLCVLFRKASSFSPSCLLFAWLREHQISRTGIPRLKQDASQPQSVDPMVKPGETSHPPVLTHLLFDLFQGSCFRSTTGDQQSGLHQGDSTESRRVMNTFPTLSVFIPAMIHWDV